jgi:hypothetical protein
MKERISILLGALLMVAGPAAAADLPDGLYDKQGSDGLHSTVEISSASGGAKSSVYELNAVVDFHVCKLTIHAVMETAIPPAYNQSDYLTGKVISCSATNNTCGSPPKCGALPVKFVQSSDTLLCLYWKGVSEGDCFKRIRSEGVNAARAGGILIERGR